MAVTITVTIVSLSHVGLGQRGTGAQEKNAGTLEQALKEAAFGDSLPFENPVAFALGTEPFWDDLNAYPQHVPDKIDEP